MKILLKQTVDLIKTYSFKSIFFRYLRTLFAIVTVSFVIATFTIFMYNRSMNISSVDNSCLQTVYKNSIIFDEILNSVDVTILFGA